MDNNEIQTEQQAVQTTAPYAEPAQQAQQPQYAEPQPQYAAPQQVYAQPEAYQQPVNFGGAAAVKRKSPVIWIVLAAVIVLIAAGVITLLMLMGGSSYEKAERSYFGNIYAAFTDEAEQAKQIHSELTVDIDEAALQQLLGTSFNLDSIGFEWDSAASGDDVMTKFALKYGAQQLLGANVWSNAKGGDVVVQLPAEITQYLLKCSLSTDAVDAASPKIDVEVLKRLLNDAASEYFAAVGKPPVEKDVKLLAGTVEVSADKTTILFTNALMTDLKNRLCTLILGNEEYLALAAEFFGNDVETERTSIQESLAAEPDYGDGTAEDVLMTMYVYTRGNEVIGREITAEGTSVQLYNITNADSYYDSFKIVLTDGTVALLESSGNIDAEGARTGTASASVSASDLVSYNVNITSTGVLITDEKIAGTIAVNVPAIALEMNVALSTTGETKSVAADISLAGTKLGKITVSASPSTLAYSAAPEVTEDNGVLYIDGNSTGKVDEFREELQGYIMSLLTKEPFASLTAMFMGGMGATDPVVEPTQPDPVVVPDAISFTADQISLAINKEKIVRVTELTGKDFLALIPEIAAENVLSESNVVNSSNTEMVALYNFAGNEAISGSDCIVTGYACYNGGNVGILGLSVGTSTKSDVEHVFGAPVYDDPDEGILYTSSDSYLTLTFSFDEKETLIGYSAELNYDEYVTGNTGAAQTPEFNFTDASGKAITYPLTVGDIAKAAGISDLSADKVPALDTDAYFGADASFSYINQNSAEADIKDCVISAIEVYSSVISINGIHNGSSRQQVLEVFGTPDDSYDDLSGYEFGNASVIIYFDGDVVDSFYFADSSVID